MTDKVLRRIRALSIAVILGGVWVTGGEAERVEAAVACQFCEPNCPHDVENYCDAFCPEHPHGHCEKCGSGHDPVPCPCGGSNPYFIDCIGHL